jgi:hypothetical protein
VRVGLVYLIARRFVAVTQFCTTVKYLATPSLPTSNGFDSVAFLLAAVCAL